MKKLTLLCRRADRDEVLHGLRALGLVHVESAQAAAGENLDMLRQRRTFLQSALHALPEPRSGVSLPPPTGEPVDAVVDRIWRLLHEREALETELAGLAQEERRVAPLGDFDPNEARRLEEHGVFLRLFRVPVRLGLPPAAALNGAVVLEITRDATVIHCVVVGREEPVLGDAVPVPLPRQSLSALRERIDEIRATLAANALLRASYAGDRPRIASLEREVDEQVRFLEIRQGMELAALQPEAGGQVALLRGWFPARRESEIMAAAADLGFGCLVSAPAPDENPPTLIENPRWVRPIEAVMDMIGVVPGYDEIDFSPLFLLFLSLFFAMLVGDAGYGLVFLGLTALLRRKRAVPASVTSLLAVMSLCTIVWGGLTGVWFGIERLPPLLAGLRIAWLTGPDAARNTMLLCFLIGAAHLTLAHLWNVVRLFPAPQFLAQLGWIGTTWAMFFTARTMVLLEPFPDVMLWVLAGGAALIVLFMTPPGRLKTEWFNHVMFPLTLIGNFVDVVSYVRLFAVGAASLAVATSFNAMAQDLGASGPLAGLGAALILFFGHGLNLLLAMMGVLVHGVRLNTLEFAGHLGLQWKGRKYDPFRERKTG